MKDVHTPKDDAHCAGASTGSTAPDVGMDAAARMNHAGMVGLLCECALRLRDSGECDELRDNIEQAISDWCAIRGWTYKRVINRIDIFPPSEE